MSRVRLSGRGKSVGKEVGDGKKARRVRTMTRTSSLCEKPLCSRPRRLADWLNPTGAKKVHSLVDKVYQMKNLEMAWRKVKANRGAGGIDGQNLKEFEAGWESHLHRLQQGLKTDTYRPRPVKRKLIAKPGQPGKQRALGIPTIYDRVCQQALLNRLERKIAEGCSSEDMAGDRGRPGVDRRCRPEGFLWVCRSRETPDAGRSTSVRRQNPCAH